VAARRAWGFAELEQLRVEHGLTVAGFCGAVGLPARTYYDRRARHLAGQSTVRGPWPTPARDGIRAVIVGLALKYPMWGHRKIAWLARHEHGLLVAEATCLRILREAGLVLPVDYVRERRDLAGARREAFLVPPTRRNQVWQMDFFELETSGGGTWRSGDVIDYWAKLVLAGPVTATQTHRDAIASVQAAIDQAEALLGGPLIEDLTDPATGEVTPIYLVSDNGPCFKAAAFARFIALQARADAHPHQEEEPADQRRDRALSRRDQDRTALARAPGRRRTDDRHGRRLPHALQRRQATRDARRRPATRPLPRRARHRALRPGTHHTPNAPTRADSLTRDTGHAW